MKIENPFNLPGLQELIDAAQKADAAPASDNTTGDTGGGGSSNDTYYDYSPAPYVSPVPVNPWITTSTYVAPTGILQADPDIIIFDDTSVSPEYLTNSFFEEFGGTELINMSRSDLIDGVDVSYSPITNLSSIRQQYNPNNIIAIGILQDDLSKISIDLAKRGPHDPYFDSNGDLVIEVDVVNFDESIEVDIATNGTINKVIL